MTVWRQFAEPTKFSGVLTENGDGAALGNAAHGKGFLDYGGCEDG